MDIPQLQAGCRLPKKTMQDQDRSLCFHFLQGLLRCNSDWLHARLRRDIRIAGRGERHEILNGFFAHEPVSFHWVIKYLFKKDQF